MTTNADADADALILIRAEGSMGRITLNRTSALNAISVEMVQAISAQLHRWETDSDIQSVVIDGAGERGFCAGGDVKSLYHSISAGLTDEADAFFRTEYHLNYQISTYPKPLVSIAHGITMGGGVGLSGHAAMRIVTEDLRMAMPETRIGFAPDVGGTWLLSRAPGRIGEYLALTGNSMSASDAIYAGFADHLVPTSHLEALREALAFRADPTTPTELIWLVDESAAPSPLAQQREWIDDVFAAGTLPELMQRIQARPEPAAQQTAQLLAELSPTALAVTLDAVRQARNTDLRGALEQEYRRMRWFIDTQPDVAAGIRAVLVDKTNTPQWQPKTVAELPADLLDQLAAHQLPPLF